jgi:hypothetical protein
MKRVYEVRMARYASSDHTYQVVGRSAEEAIKKARRAAARDYGVKSDWRCKAVTETGTVIL